MSATSDRYTPQRQNALQRANEIRLARADLKRRITGGEVSAAGVILEPPEEAETWPIGEVLMSQWGWGTTRMRKVLNRARIVETKPVGMLTDRQRRELASMLGTRTTAGEGER
jgi:hypothetical protein